MRATVLKLAAGLVVVLPAAAATPPADEWEIGPIVRGRNYSLGMPLNPQPGPNGSVAFDFPVAGRGQVDALTTATGPLAGARAITIRYRIIAAPRTRFVADETPGEPATVSVYFQQAGDTWSARGRYASYRWYSPARAVIPLAVGEHNVTVRLDEIWTNVNGQPNAGRPGEFADALRRTERVGLAFGSSARRSHGVYATAPARFQLLDFAVR